MYNFTSRPELPSSAMQDFELKAARISVKRALFRIYYRIVILFLAFVVRKRTDIVLIGAMCGNWYGDNGQHLFEWALRNRSNIRPIWVTREPAIVAQLERLGMPVVNAFSNRAIFLLARSSVAVYSNGIEDICAQPSSLPKHIRLLALTHGNGVKKVRFARESHRLSEQERRRREHESTHIQYLITSSDYIADLEEANYEIGRNKLIVTGYPKNDCLFHASMKEQRWWNDFLGDLHPERILLYGPTWRHGRAPTRFFPFCDFDLDELVDFIELSNTLILIRPHVNDLRNAATTDFITTLAAASPRLRLATHLEFPDVNSIMRFADAIITDYSGLFHDFLLLDRPILFFPYDYEDYRRQNGFHYDYLGQLPGPAVYSQREFLEQLRLLIDGNDSFKEARRQLNRKVNAYTDDGSCERVWAVLEEMCFRQ